MTAAAALPLELALVIPPPAARRERPCGESSGHDGSGWECTREHGHAPPHVAHVGERPVAIWLPPRQPLDLRDVLEAQS